MEVVSTDDGHDAHGWSDNVNMPNPFKLSAIYNITHNHDNIVQQKHTS